MAHSHRNLQFVDRDKNVLVRYFRILHFTTYTCGYHLIFKKKIAKLDTTILFYRTSHMNMEHA